MINELFKFPIIMIDGRTEAKKAKTNRLLGKGGDEGDVDEYDMIFGEAEYPYYDFIGMEDRWMPCEASLIKAMEGDFDACIVRFVNVGELLVPWSKKKFKEKITKFAQEYEASLPPRLTERREVKILTLTPDQYNDIVDGDKSQDNEQK